MCKNLDSPHPLTPSPKDGRRGTRVMSPLSHVCYGVHTSLLTLPYKLLIPWLPENSEVRYELHDGVIPPIFQLYPLRSRGSCLSRII